jgi:hypothetical protein
MHKVNKFKDFLNEASLEGNIGIPGEEGSGRESWLKKVSQRADVNAREFANQNRADIQNFMGLVRQSEQLQSGYEQELSDLTVESFRKVFGSLLDDIDLDFKIGDREEIKGEMEETPAEQPELEKLEDEGIINQINKRKILRTIQQGKGLSAKAILNLSLFKKGLVEIMGQENAAKYLTVLNKIANVAQFFDWTVPIEMQKQMWQARQGFSGSCDIEFGEEVKNKEDEAQKVLDDLAKGEDIVDNENMEELVSGLNIKIVARGVDLSVLIHEAIKGIYKLPTQASLEALYGDTAETVLMNTDTLFDELEEIKFGRPMQDVFFKQVSEHPLVVETVDNMMRNGAEDWEIASFQERLNFLFFGKIAMIGQEDAKECLTIVNAILSESGEAQELCDPIMREALRDLSAEEEYQAHKRQATSREPNIDTETPEDWQEPKEEGEPKMSPEEIRAKIKAAVAAEEYEEAARLAKLLGEGFIMPRFSFSDAVFEKKDEFSQLKAEVMDAFRKVSHADFAKGKYTEVDPQIEQVISHIREILKKYE